jgi:hypothetical protein
MSAHGAEPTLGRSLKNRVGLYCSRFRRPFSRFSPEIRRQEIWFWDRLELSKNSALRSSRVRKLPTLGEALHSFLLWRADAPKSVFKHEKQPQDTTVTCKLMPLEQAGAVSVRRGRIAPQVMTDRAIRMMDPDRGSVSQSLADLGSFCSEYNLY